ncbi:MAG: tetratricopeptide repeat protein [Fibrobacteria bacterium]|nr:tetratricopeptide repeat protein [Fibrobacteria bacterium]
MKISTSQLALLSIALLTSAGFAAKQRSADCVQLDKLRSQATSIGSDISDIQNEGKAKRAKCESESNSDKKQRCIDGLQPLRDKMAALQAKAGPIRDDIQKYSALCDEASVQTVETQKLYESVAKENCRSGGDEKRCEDALFNLADLAYTSDQRENLANRERYERAYDKWRDNDKSGKEPSPVPPSYTKGLAAHKKYLSSIKGGTRRDVILYRTAFILDMVGQSSDAFPILMELSTKFPNSRHITPANLRIGEYYFVEKKYDSAIVYYNKVDANAAGQDGVVGLALFHKGEAQYNLGRYEKANAAFFDYIERVDKGQISRGDLRSEAILYMGSCFAEYPGSFSDAKKFFKKQGGRNYEDTLFYELAVKHADRDQHEVAIDALEFFLKNYPDYYKAPLAQLKLIEVWDKRKKIEEAQEAREVLIQKFGRGSAWWSKPRNIDKRELEMIQGRIRDAMLEVAMQQHFPGKDRRDTTMVKKGIASYERFIRSYEPEGNWPIYRAKIYLADALSWVGRNEEAADIYIWASKENVNDSRKYREPNIAERKLTQPADAGFNAVLELQLAANAEVDRQGGDSKKAYNTPIAKRYMDAVENYIKLFPKAADVDALAYNIFLYQVNGEDWEVAIASGNRLLKMAKDFKDFKYTNDARARLAYCYTQAGKFADAEREYKLVITALPKGDSLNAQMSQNIGEVIWRMAENSEKGNKVDSAVFHYRRIARDYPQLNMADSAAFRAAVALENAKRHKEAATEYMNFERNYRTRSGLCIMAIQAAADQYRQAGDTASGVAILVDSLYRYYPKTDDSAAFKGISQAASLYEAAGRMSDKAKTLELYYTRYPKHDMTPGFLYTAGLTYEKLKDWSNAVRVYTTVVKDFPKHQYAPEAAFSIPIIEEKQGNRDKMATTYESFAAQYPNDKSKVAKAYLRAASYYDSMKNVKKADELFDKLVKFYQTGDNSVQVDASFPAEAYYRMAMHRTAEAEQATKIGGTSDAKKLAEQIKNRLEALKKADELFDNSIKLLIEEWTMKSGIQKADNVNQIMLDLLAMPEPKGTKLKDIQERILFRVGIFKGLLPTMAAKSAKEYESFLAIQRKSGIQDSMSKRASDNILYAWYMTGKGFEQIGNAIAEEPCPSAAKQGSDQYMEECEYHKAMKEDNQIQFQKVSVVKGYTPGIEKAAELGIVGPYLDSIRARVKYIAPEDASLQVQVVETKIEARPEDKTDKELLRALARIKEIAEGDLPPEEKVRVLRSMVIEGQRIEDELKTEIQELSKKK